MIVHEAPQPCLYKQAGAEQVQFANTYENQQCLVLSSGFGAPKQQPSARHPRRQPALCLEQLTLPRLLGHHGRLVLPCCGASGQRLLAQTVKSAAAHQAQLSGAQLSLPKICGIAGRTVAQRRLQRARPPA